MSTQPLATPSKLDHALEHARAGRAVFPCWWPLADGQCACGQADCGNAGKHPLGPLVPHGVKEATTDHATIRRWWGRFPHANIGWAIPAGMFVLDMGPRHGGDDSLFELERQYGRLPTTPEAISGGGGRHLLFATAGLPVGNTTIAPGLDSKSAGGAIIVAGSSHASGGVYEWDAGRHPDDTPLAAAPPWLRARLRPAGDSRRRSSRGTAELLAGVGEGGRDVALFELTLRLHRAGAPEDVTLDLLADAAAKCVPPYPAEKAAEKVRRVYGETPVEPLSTSGEDLPATLERRVVALEQELARRNERDREERRILANSGMEAATKLVALEVLHRVERHRARGQDGPLRIANVSLGKAVGMTPKCVGRHVRLLADTFGALRRVEERHHLAPTETTPARVETWQFLDLPGSVAEAAQALATAAVPGERRHGGARTAFCPAHPDAPVRVTVVSTRACTVDGEIFDEQREERTIIRRRMTRTPEPCSLTTQDGPSTPVVRIATQDGPSALPPTSPPPPAAADPVCAAGWSGARQRPQPPAAPGMPLQSRQEGPRFLAPAGDGEAARLSPRGSTAGSCLDCGTPLPPDRQDRCQACASPAPDAGP